MLAEMLALQYMAAQDAIVLAIPSGGVPVGLQVSALVRLKEEGLPTHRAHDRQSECQLM